VIIITANIISRNIINVSAVKELTLYKILHIEERIWEKSSVEKESLWKFLLEKL